MSWQIVSDFTHPMRGREKDRERGSKLFPKPLPTLTCNHGTAKGVEMELLPGGAVFLGFLQLKLLSWETVSWTWFGVREHGASLLAWCRGDNISFGLRENCAQCQFC